MTSYAFFSPTVHSRNPKETFAVHSQGRTVPANFIGGTISGRPAIREGGKMVRIPHAETYRLIGEVSPKAWQVLEAGRASYAMMNQIANAEAQPVRGRAHWASGAKLAKQNSH